jgi:hypothetical protein
MKLTVSPIQNLNDCNTIVKIILLGIENFGMLGATRYLKLMRLLLKSIIFTILYSENTNYNVIKFIIF